MGFRVERWSEENTPDERELRKRLEAEGYSVFQWSDAPATTYSVHNHAEDQSHWILSVALELTVDGESYVLNAGDRDFLPAHTNHAARVVSREPVVYLIGARKE
jgi:quercetin dioxygenase-like cupin family protein